MALACWRLSALFVYECGPWHIFRKFRDKIGITSRLDNCEPLSWDDNLLANLFGCVWCISIWFAIMIYVTYKIWPGGTILILSPFAISAGAIIAEKLIRG